MKKKIKLKTFLLTSISILFFSYRTPPVAASVFLPGIKNLNDIALAIKTKPYGKKLQLPGGVFRTLQKNFNREFL